MYEKPISYSGLSTFKKCPKLWEWQYILGNRSAPGPAAQRGTTIHAVLEAYFNANPYPEGDLLFERWRTYMAGLASRSPKSELQLAVNADWDPVAFDDPTAYFRGVVDLFVPGEIEVDIYDWKTGRMYDSHAAQAAAYVALAPGGHTKYVTHFVYLDNYPTITTTFFSPEERSAAIDELRTGVEAIRTAEEYKPTPSQEACRWCALSWRNGGPCRAAP
jgi:PD-(D/E)XK nuclease superfamily